MSLHCRKVKETQQTFEKHLNHYQIILLHPYLRKTLKILPPSQVERVYVIHSINILFHLATFLKVLAFLQLCLNTVHLTRQTTPTQTFLLKPLSTIEVFNAICSIDPKNSTGADQLEPWLLLIAAPLLVECIAYIFNLTVETCHISDLWKSAHILPLHKEGQWKELDNPISKLSCLAKVLQKLVNDQVRAFLSQHSILKSYQSGFRPGYSTVTATSKVSNITCTLGDKQDCITSFIDLSKAFDSINHWILLKHLEVVVLMTLHATGLLIILVAEHKLWKLIVLSPVT